MFLTGTLLNVAAVLIGTTIGLLIGGRMPPKLQQALTDALGLFVLALGFALALGLLMDSNAPATASLAVLGGLLAGAAIGELLRLSDRLDALGAWFQGRLAKEDRPSRVSEAFITTSLVFCVGPLAILGSIQNGLSGNIDLLAVKSLLDGVASIAFAAALGAGVYLSALTVLTVQGGLALAAMLVGAGIDPLLIDVATAVGGLTLLGVGLNLLEIRRIRVVNLLPGVVLAPLFLAVVAQVTDVLL